MARKNKTEKTAPQPGDMIVTMRNQERITAVITDVSDGVTAVQVVGPEFMLTEKDFAPAES